MSYSEVYINVSGGILSPGHLQTIATIAQKFGILHLFFGERQNIYFKADLSIYQQFITELNKNSIETNTNNTEKPNIVSSYAASGIFTPANSWLKEGTYMDVLAAIDFSPKLKVNIVDPNQSLTPIFTGDLNFIASEIANFWYLLINIENFHSNGFWPFLVFTNHIDEVILHLEQEISTNPNLSMMEYHSLINKKFKFIEKDVENQLNIRRQRFPIYEGLNPMGENNWLGIFRRDACFNLDFLLAVCELCSNTKIGQLCLTSWKTLLIKGIKEEDRFKWEIVLGKYGINIRHSSSELNWQLPDNDDKALDLRNFLTTELAKRDVRTYGLSFAIHTSKFDSFASVTIEEAALHSIFGKSLVNLYTIKYSPNFLPNQNEKQTFINNIPKSELSKYLIRLSFEYFEFLHKQLSIAPTVKEGNTMTHSTIMYEDYYQCIQCLTVYDPKLGDEEQSIEPNTDFESLPEYHCPVCDAPKMKFKQMAQIG